MSEKRKPNKTEVIVLTAGALTTAAAATASIAYIINKRKKSQEQGDSQPAIFAEVPDETKLPEHIDAKSLQALGATVVQSINDNLRRAATLIGRGRRQEDEPGSEADPREIVVEDTIETDD